MEYRGRDYRPRRGVVDDGVPARRLLYPPVDGGSESKKSLWEHARQKTLCTLPHNVCTYTHIYKCLSLLQQRVYTLYSLSLFSYICICISIHIFFIFPSPPRGYLPPRSQRRVGAQFSPLPSPDSRVHNTSDTTTTTRALLFLLQHSRDIILFYSLAKLSLLPAAARGHRPLFFFFFFFVSSQAPTLGSRPLSSRVSRSSTQTTLSVRCVVYGNTTREKKKYKMKNKKIKHA